VFVALSLASIVIFEGERLHFPAVWTYFMAGYDSLLYDHFQAVELYYRIFQILILIYQVAEIVRVQGEKSFYRYHHPRTMEERDDLMQPQRARQEEFWRSWIL